MNKKKFIAAISVVVMLCGGYLVLNGIEQGKDNSKNEMTYIVNVNTGVFHYIDCRGVRQMKESNKKYVTCDRKELLNQGYKSCGICHP